ncbi:hypothetical protein N9H39_06490 [Gammaproteobacteria bacterium]|nr:hypothetical protein [Gammaproteobacteria bacterium]
MKNIKSADLKFNPFPYLVKTPAFDDDFYRKLSTDYDRFAREKEKEKWDGRWKMDFESEEASEILESSQSWSDLFKSIYNARFIRECFDLFREPLKQYYPNIRPDRVLMGCKNRDIEQTFLDRLGRKIKFYDDSYYVRSDFSLARTGYKVGPHHDVETKRIAGLLYLTPDSTASTGGNLVILEEIIKLGNKNYNRHKTEIADSFEIVDTVNYQPNTICIFLNTKKSFHAVTPFMQGNSATRRFIYFSLCAKDKHLG